MNIPPLKELIHLLPWHRNRQAIRNVDRLRMCLKLSANAAEQTSYHGQLAILLKHNRSARVHYWKLQALEQELVALDASGATKEADPSARAAPGR